MTTVKEKLAKIKPLIKSIFYGQSVFGQPELRIGWGLVAVIGFIVAICYGFFCLIHFFAVRQWQYNKDHDIRAMVTCQSPYGNTLEDGSMDHFDQAWDVPYVVVDRNTICMWDDERLETCIINTPCTIVENYKSSSYDQ